MKRDVLIFAEDSGTIGRCKSDECMSMSWRIPNYSLPGGAEEKHVDLQQQIIAFHIDMRSTGVPR
jgi:hypothetical protein